MKDKKRLSGILLHPTSLPSPYGIGDLGEAAYEFVDFLAAAGQHLWQILPPDMETRLTRVFLPLPDSPS